MMESLKSIITQSLDLSASMKSEVSTEQSAPSTQRTSKKGPKVSLEIAELRMKMK